MPGPFEGRLSRLIRHRREELHLTQQQVAEVLGVTPDFVSLVESGHRRLSLDHIGYLAHALAVHPTLLCKIALRERAPFFFAQLFADWAGGEAGECPSTHGGEA
jgi:transcriptional regulator with XRE-family HTH domain